MADEKSQVKSTEVKTTQPAAVQPMSTKNTMGMKLLVGLASLAVLFFAFALGHRTASLDHDTRIVNVRGPQQMMRDGAEDGGDSMRGGMMRGEAGQMSSDEASKTRVAGVVTVVDGDTITVAGNGTTTKVLVSGNTSYTGDDNPAKVNDTIMAFGAKNSDDALVASTVRLARQ